MFNVLSYRRNDGVVGVGFLIEYGGIQQHSIAWPDRTSERYSASTIADHLIEVIESVDDKQEAISEADKIRAYFVANPEATNKDVIDALAVDGVIVTSSQVSKARKA